MARRAVNTPLPIEGTGISLRALVFRDAAAVAQMVSDPEVIKQTLTMSTPYRLEEAEDWIGQELAGNGKKRQVLVVEAASSKALIGTVSVEVKRRFFRPYGMIGYWIGRPYWGQGFGSEALKIFLDYCAEEMALHRFEAKVFDDNEASQRVLEKNGFQRSGKVRLFVPKRGGWRRVYLYRLRSMGVVSKG
ncbi:MAG: N-acetyltransferase [Alphaproteobacteria bacterium]|nr:MAG: N-acetyltransferase [Alphaproteobacteria bacterium]